jgi:hypothetical protein
VPAVGSTPVPAAAETGMTNETASVTHNLFAAIVASFAGRECVRRINGFVRCARTRIQAQ